MARVAVDLPLAHLDRCFDYVVPELMHSDAVPGCRVKVRFAGRDVDGFVVERVDHTDHVGELAPLRRVVSSEPVLTAQVLSLCRLTADRFAGTLADVLRLAVPPRHARVEAEAPAATPVAGPPQPEVLAASWGSEAGGAALVRRLIAGESPRAVWGALPGADWAEQLATLVAATSLAGRGSIVCLPDARDVTRVDSAFRRLLGSTSHVVLTSELGPAARYRAFLAVARGSVQVVVGNRAASFAPVRDLGLVAIWDDGDDSHAEPRAPYPHVREVLLLRAHQEQTAAVIGGLSRSVEAHMLVESGWAAPVVAGRPALRAAACQIHVTGETGVEHERDAMATAARVPRRVFEVVRQALAQGPVLVHHPRQGYYPALSCDHCRRPAHCSACSGPLTRSGRDLPPRCRLCARAEPDWSCPHCHGARLRAPVVGSQRTAEEWGRSFPQTTVLASGGDRIIATVDDQPAIVVATPGAEPAAAEGYAAAVLLDTWLTVSRADLRAGEEALRRWLNVAALVRPASRGGRLIAVGEASLPPLQALVRWDPAGFAARELADRRATRLTPAARVATLTAASEELGTALASLELPRYVDVLGPFDLDGGRAHAVLRAPLERGSGLTRALQRMQAGRSSRKLGTIRVRLDATQLD